MNGDEIRKLDRIEDAILKLTEGVSYNTGRLEEIHARTAEIPLVVEEQGKLKRAYRIVAIVLFLGIIAHAKEVLAWATSLIQ